MMISSYTNWHAAWTSTPCAAGVASYRNNFSNTAPRHRRQAQSPVLCRKRGGGGHQHAAFVFRDDSIYDGAKRIDEPLIRSLLPVLQSNGMSMSAQRGTLSSALATAGQVFKQHVGAHTDRRCHEEA